MKKIERELIEHKFQKLNDANKIRYNLGRIISNQFRIFLMVMLFGLLITGCVLFLPFIIRHDEIYKVVGLAIFGVLILVMAFILGIVGIYKLYKTEKSTEDFLNEKSKK